MHPDHPLGVARRRRDRRDEQRRGVRGEHASAVDDARELAVEVVLELEALGDGLDHELAWCQQLESLDRLQALGRNGRLLGAEATALGFLVEAGPGALQAAVE